MKGLKVRSSLSYNDNDVPIPFDVFPKWERITHVFGKETRWTRSVLRLQTVYATQRRSLGNRGDKGDTAPPTFQGGEEQKEVSVPLHFCAHTYLKIPPRSLFFRPHNSTVLTPNQSVRRCFKKFIGVGTGRTQATPPLFFQGEWVCWKSLRASFSMSSNIIFLHNQCVSVEEQTLELSKCRKPCRPHTSIITLTYLGAGVTRLWLVTRDCFIGWCGCRWCSTDPSCNSRLV